MAKPGRKPNKVETSVELVESKKEKPTKDNTPNGDIQKARQMDYEKAQKVFHGQWEGERRTVIDLALPEQTQIRRLLAPCLAEVFGGNDEEYIIGFFTDKEVGDRLSRGYVVLRESLFPTTMYNKPTWSKAISARLMLHTHVDGTIRWGSRRENFVCIIKKDWWLRNKEEQETLNKKKFEEHIREGTNPSAEDEGTTEASISKVKVPRAKPK